MVVQPEPKSPAKFPPYKLPPAASTAYLSVSFKAPERLKTIQYGVFIVNCGPSVKLKSNSSKLVDSAEPEALSSASEIKVPGKPLLSE